MSTDDRMDTITDPAAIRAVWEAGDMDEESLGGDSESGTYNRSNRPTAGPRPDADDPWRFTRFVADDHECVIVRDEYDEPAPFGSCSTHRRALSSPVALGCTTPARVGAAVALDLDALHETICDKFTGMAEVRQAADLLVVEVRHMVKFRDWWRASSLANAEDVRRLTAICHEWRDRSEAAEAEVGTLRARLARARHCGCGWCCSNNADSVIPGDAHLSCSRYAALAVTIGEGE